MSRRTLDVESLAALSPFADPVVVVSDDTVIWHNDAAAELFAREDGSLEGLDVAALSVDNPPYRPATFADRVEAAADPFDWVVESDAGERIPVRVAVERDNVDGRTVSVVGFRRRSELGSEISELHDVALELEGCHTVEEVYDLTIRAAETVLDFDVCSLVVADGDELVTVAASESVGEAVHERVPDDSGIVGKTYQTGESVLLDDIHDSGQANPARESYRSLISVPVGDRGVFQTATTESGAYTERDVELAELLAAHVNAALERLRSQADMRRQKQRITDLHAAAAELKRCEDEDETYERAIDALDDLLDPEVSAIFVAEDGVLKPATTSERIDLFPRTVDEEAGVAGDVWTHGESQLTRDVAADDAAKPAGESLRSALSVRIDGVGVVQAAADEPDAFDENDLELAELLAQHVSEVVTRIRADRERRRRDRRISSMLSNLPGIVYQCDAEGGLPWDITFVSPFITELTGHDPADVVAGEPHLAELVHPEDRGRVSDEIRAAVEAGEPFEVTYRLLTSDGDFRWVRERGEEVGDPDAGSEVDTVVGIIIDITDVKHREHLAVLNRYLRHNVRNDLNVVLGHAEFLADSEDAAVREHGREISEKAWDILESSTKVRRIQETLETNTRRVEIDLVKLVESTVDEFARNSTADIHTHLPEECFVRANPSLEYALVELLANAVEHVDDPEPRIDVSVTPIEDGEDADWWLSVSDEGAGIPEYERAVLKRGTETKLEHSSGLGLWLVNWVVSTSRGTLAFESGDDGGTCIRLGFRAADQS